MKLPRVLVIDDLFGRAVPNRRNPERENLCGNFLLLDVTGDEQGKEEVLRIEDPIAEAVFHRGQLPLCAAVGDTVENDPAGVLGVIRSGWAGPESKQPRWTLVLLDLCFYTGVVTQASSDRASGMPESRPSDLEPQNYFGLKILKMIHEKFPGLPVVMLSSMPREEVSREYTRLGASTFLPRDIENGADVLREIISHHGLLPDPAAEMLGNSMILLSTLRSSRKLAASNENILIRGERGTGKELLARYIHRVTQESTGQRRRPMVTVNSGSLTAELYASQLFGHKKGSFTSANEDRVGSILQADGGDLFLDEIGNMPSGVQDGILRVLEERSVTPLGGRTSDSCTVQVRFLSATNSDLESQSAMGRFREDLYDRLRRGGVVVLPPLRERKEDIPLLVSEFVTREVVRSKAKTRSIEPDVLEVLTQYGWPGNVRELENCIREAIAKHRDAEHLIADHIELPKQRKISVEDGSHQSGSRSVGEHSDRGSELADDFHLDRLLRIVREFPYEKLDAEDISGQYSELRAACAKLLAGCLRAALETSKRRTLQNPKGEFLLHPALKMLTGDANLKAPQAYDLVKRIIQLSPEEMPKLLEDPLLREAFRRSLAGRPAGKDKSKREKPE